ncbi:MAG: hypothetical protein M3M86_02915, partial [Thermoproteota archaeon]|nr:hypothetical protein [Thermoproteota archaeon]
MIARSTNRLVYTKSKKLEVEQTERGSLSVCCYCRVFILTACYPVALAAVELAAVALAAVALAAVALA